MLRRPTAGAPRPMRRHQPQRGMREGERTMQVTGTHHVALYTANLERLRAFYVETLGLPQLGAFPGGRIIFIDAGSTTGSWQHLAFEVADVAATYEALTAQGITFHVHPKDVPEESPSARIAFFKDPDGNILELFQPLGERYPQGGD